MISRSAFDRRVRHAIRDLSVPMGWAGHLTATARTFANAVTPEIAAALPDATLYAEALDHLSRVPVRAAEYDVLHVAEARRAVAAVAVHVIREDRPYLIFQPPALADRSDPGPVAEAGTLPTSERGATSPSPVVWVSESSDETYTRNLAEINEKIRNARIGTASVHRRRR